MIKAGTIWEHDWQVLEWQEDMTHGKPITAKCVKIDGEHPLPHDPIPRWVMDRIMGNAQQ